MSTTPKLYGLPLAEQDERAAETLSKMFDATRYGGAEHDALLHALALLRIRIADREAETSGRRSTV